MRIGLVINPMAGLGGSVGLKGSDGQAIQQQALDMGAIPQAIARSKRALTKLSARFPGCHIITMPGSQGEEACKGLDLTLEVRPRAKVYGTSQDSIEAVSLMQDCDLILFAGGDGTARDIASALSPNMGMLGIPCGVKMHSAVFAITPEAAGAAIANLLNNLEKLEWDEHAEIVDIIEDDLRLGRLSPRLFTHARVPKLKHHIQAAKGGGRTNSDAGIEQAACEIIAQMLPNILYIIGPGRSAGAVMRQLGFEPSLIGIDIICNKALVAQDASAAQIRALVQGREIRIILGITGVQGFLIGRGNQQLTPDILAQSGRNGLIVIAAEDKLLRLAQPNLWIDSGDLALDLALSGYLRVNTGRGRQMLMKVNVCE